MSNSGARVNEADVTDACERLHISWREPTPPPAGSTLFFFWWCARCHRRYRHGVTNTCLYCGERFRKGVCRSLWFHVNADGVRSPFVWNQRFCVPGSREAERALRELQEIVAEAGVLSVFDEDEEEEGQGEVAGGDVPDAS